MKQQKMACQTLFEIAVLCGFLWGAMMKGQGPWLAREFALMPNAHTGSFLVHETFSDQLADIVAMTYALESWTLCVVLGHSAFEMWLILICCWFCRCTSRQWVIYCPHQLSPIMSSTCVTSHVSSWVCCWSSLSLLRTGESSWGKHSPVNVC